MCQGTKSIDDDLRQLIVTNIKEGGGNTETGVIPKGLYAAMSKKYQIHQTTVKRIWMRFVETESVTASKRGNKVGNQRILNEEDEEYVEQLLCLDPTLFHYEIQEKVLQNSNNPSLNSLSIPTINRTIKHRLSGKQWSRKKVESSNKNRYTQDNVRLTQEYFDFIATQNPVNIKFMDEAGVNTSSGKRNYGCSHVGEVAVQISRHAQGPNHTVNLLIGLDGTKFCTVHEGAQDSTGYVGFFHEAMNGHSDLGQPILQPGDIIVVDNCATHHFEAEEILTSYFEDYDIQYVFLPKYSPDLNPVEKCFSKMKTLLKQGYYQALLSESHVEVAVLGAVGEITMADIYQFYKSCLGNYMNLQ